MVNQAAKAHYMSGAEFEGPIVFRTTLGATQALGRPALAVAPGLGEPRPRPARWPAGDAPGRPDLMKTASRDDEPWGHLRGQDDVPG